MHIVLRPDRRPSVSVILPALLIGEYVTPIDVEWLKATHGVTAVVNLQDHGDLSSKGLRLRALEATYRQHAIRFHHEPIGDGDTEALGLRLGVLVPLLRNLIADGARVYLHCNGGFNRAPTVAIAYVHAQLQVPLAEAVEFVKQRRPCVPYVSVLTAYYAKRHHSRPVIRPHRCQGRPRVQLTPGVTRVRNAHPT